MQKTKTPRVAAPAANATRAARMQAVANALIAQRKAAKLAKHQAAQAKAAAAAAQAQAMANFNAAVQQAAAQYGIANPVVGLPRANSATATPSAKQITLPCGVYLPTKAVHVLAAQHRTRKATIVACLAVGINYSTASTQYNAWRKAQA